MGTTIAIIKYRVGSVVKPPRSKLAQLNKVTNTNSCMAKFITIEISTIANTHNWNPTTAHTASAPSAYG